MDRISAQFEQLHDKALTETNVARSQEHFDPNLQVCAKFGKIFVEAEEIIKSSPLLKDEEERNWILASFVSAYLAGIQSKYGFFPTTLTECIPPGEEIMKAITNTVPGDMRTLVMAARFVKEPSPTMGDEGQAIVSEQAREACIGVFGRHSEDVIKALVLYHSNRHFL